jgi:hypothetical protein
MLEHVNSNKCHHIRTDLNALDSPIVDVLLVVPIGPSAERDARIMRQAVQMWEGGIDYLAPQMGLDWLGTGTDFRITVETLDATSDKFSLYPVVDPEIVVIAGNLNGDAQTYAGIGIDPVNRSDVTAIAEELTGRDLPVPDDVPCVGLTNVLFDLPFWDSLPGFDNHHGHSGTYTQDCGEGGGNMCFAVMGALDTLPGDPESDLFDLVAHEFGHCLTLGHVGDGAEGSWGKLPPNDIMAYDEAPAGLNKCVSTLDVEGFAIRMSRYVDVNGDGAATAADRLFANDPKGDGDYPFQTQNPRDHYYASKTGKPRDCPQASLGLLPGPRTDWTANPVTTATRVITVTSPSSGARTSDATLTVAGTVDRGVGSEPSVSSETPASATAPRTVTFTHPGGNTFNVADTSAAARTDSRHVFDLDLPSASDVTFTLAWRSFLGLGDLDLFVTGAASSGFEGAGGGNPEHVTLTDVRGHLDIAVDPFIILDPITGVPYTLTAVITPHGAKPDRDRDDTPDESDVCLNIAGAGADGCPIEATERVLVYIDGATNSSANQDVDTTLGRDDFSFQVWVPRGEHTLRVVWASTKGRVYATRSVAYSAR